MRTPRSPLTVLGCLYLCFLAVIEFSAAGLPDPVAVHFDGKGIPNGWMTQEAHFAFSVMLALALPLSIVGIFYSLRHVPTKLINIPDRDYWLAPERRSGTFDFLLRHALWLSCLSLCFVIGIDLLILHANSRSPARLSTPLTGALLAGFLFPVFLWVVRLARYFKR